MDAVSFATKLVNTCFKTKLDWNPFFQEEGRRGNTQQCLMFGVKFKGGNPLLSTEGPFILRDL